LDPRKKIQLKSKERIFFLQVNGILFLLNSQEMKALKIG